MRLGNVAALWLFLAVPVAVLAYALAFRSRRRRLARLGQAPMVERMIAGVSVTRQAVRAGLVVAGVGLLVLALARPQAGGRAKLTRQRGLDLIVALDFSKSMLAKDVYPSRLERAKRELERLIDHLAGDRVGLVAFAGETLSYPPTTDYAALKLFWRDLSPWDMAVGGTALGRALRAGTDVLVRLRSQEGRAGNGGAPADGRAQVILLLTDGEDTESEPLEAAEAASKVGIRVYAVGIGSRSGELIPEFDDKGEITGYVKDSDGKYVTSRLGEETLARIAQKTGGEYFHADPRQFGVEQVEAALAGLKRSENEARVIKEYDEVYEVPLLAAFLLLVAEACMSDRRRAGRLPAPGARTATAASMPASASLQVWVFLALLPLLPFLAAWSPLERRSAAVEEGNGKLGAGKADEALSAYDKAVAELPADPAAHFDRGTALAALSRFDEAAEEFLRATEAKDPSLKAAAFYNLGNAFFKKDKFKEAIEAYKRTLALDPKADRAKWNLEIALKKKRDEDQKKDKDKDQDKKDKDDKKRDDKKQDDKKQDDKKQDDKKNQDKQKDEDKPEPKADQKPNPEKPEEKPASEREIESVLDSLEKSPKDLEKQRAMMRAVRRSPPARDW